MNKKMEYEEDELRTDLAKEYGQLKDTLQQVSLDMIEPLVQETERVVNENMKVFGSS